MAMAGVTTVGARGFSVTSQTVTKLNRDPLWRNRQTRDRISNSAMLRDARAPSLPRMPEDLALRHGAQNAPRAAWQPASAPELPARLWGLPAMQDDGTCIAPVQVPVSWCNTVHGTEPQRDEISLRPRRFLQSNNPPSPPPSPPPPSPPPPSPPPSPPPPGPPPSPRHPCHL